jgi:hypothetical protein
MNRTNAVRRVFKPLQTGTFTLEKAFQHLEHQYLTYKAFRQEIRNVRIAWMAVLPPEYGPAEMYEELIQRGWVTFPYDGSSGMRSTVRFEIKPTKLARKTPSKQAKPRRKLTAK